MLPPMAIFFPLFTLLEDSGYLPRIAFNMDKHFKKAGAHGKQSLTMCMGFGCNACGVIGCRIIDSPRERLIAILTNNFVPCNGRFPTLIAVITMFFAGAVALPLQSIFSTLMLIGVILLGIVMTLLISRFLSSTLLKGEPSSFALELPPYRTPQIGRVIVRSVFDRTLFVLGRAAAVAAPAGLIIWCMANLYVGDASILTHCSQFLDPFAKILGMDGVILLAFILGFPANEIVVPIIIMSYLCTGSMMEFDSLAQLHTLLTDHGWTWVTALCVMIFSLMHFLLYHQKGNRKLEMDRSRLFSSYCMRYGSLLFHFLHCQDLRTGIIQVRVSQSFPFSFFSKNLPLSILILMIKGQRPTKVGRWLFRERKKIFKPGTHWRALNIYPLKAFWYIQAFALSIPGPAYLKAVPGFPRSPDTASL